MKTLLYFSGKLYEPKGTPIRVRNMVSELLKNGLDVWYAGYDVPEGLAASHVLLLRTPFLRVLDIIQFIRKNKIRIFYVQTSAGLWLAPLIRIFTSARVGVDFHSLRIEEENAYNEYRWLSYRVRVSMELLFTRFLHFGTGVCRPLQEYYRCAVPNFFVLPVGVDTNLFRADVPPDPETLRWKGESVLIGYAGNTKWYQGVEVILESLVQLEKETPGRFKLLMVASSGASEVETFVREHQLSGAVKLLGKQSHENVPKFLAASDVLAIPRPSDRITEYAFPSKFPEYLALGKPVVISKVSDVADYVVDGVSAMVIRPENADDLCAALRRLENKELRRAMGRAARGIAETVFDLSVLGKHTAAYLETL